MSSQTIPTILCALALCSTLACKSEIDDKPKAKVEAAEKTDAKADDKADAKADDKAAPADAKTLALAAEGSSIGFIGAKITNEHKGSFGKFEGSATVEGGKLAAVSITIEMESLTADAEDLTGHLKSPDFFDIGTYPKASFTSLEISEKAGDNGATHEIAGNLEMRGKANKVTFPATVEVTETGVHGKAEFSIDRKLWDITYPGKPDDLIKDEVALILDLNFK